MYFAFRSKDVAGTCYSTFFIRHEDIRLPDRNALLADKTHHVGCENVKRLRYILEHCHAVCNTVTDTLKAGKFPLVLSADNEITPLAQRQWRHFKEFGGIAPKLLPICF